LRAIDSGPSQAAIYHIGHNPTVFQRQVWGQVLEKHGALGAGRAGRLQIFD
jgi:hypothetical protein